MHVISCMFHPSFISQSFHIYNLRRGSLYTPLQPLSTYVDAHCYYCMQNSIVSNQVVTPIDGSPNMLHLLCTHFSFNFSLYINYSQFGSLLFDSIVFVDLVRSSFALATKRRFRNSKPRFPSDIPEQPSYARPGWFPILIFTCGPLPTYNVFRNGTQRPFNIC